MDLNENKTEKQEVSLHLFFFFKLDILMKTLLGRLE